MGALPSNYDYFHRCAVQKALNEKTRVSPPLKIDGQFGPASCKVLSIYQKQNNLPETGVYDDASQGLLEPFINSKYVDMQDLRDAANDLGVDLPSILAVAQTESKGAGFFSDGSCTILFERHLMYQCLMRVKAAGVVNGLMNRFPTVIDPKPGGYLLGIAEYNRFNLAAGIDRNCALQSASWGMFQILGMNANFCGYSSVEAYVADMKTSEQLQLKAFVKFIKTYAGGALWRALKAKDWQTFARIYNGPGNMADYSANMSSNFKLWKDAA